MEELFRRFGPVEELVLDDDLHEHLLERGGYRKHQVTLAEVLQVHQGQPKYFENEGANRRAPLIMVGATSVGRVLSVPIEPSGRYGIWRPVTAFESNAHHRNRYYSEENEGPTT